MLSCRDFVHRHASDYIDHQLHGRQKFGVSLHLLLCGHCRRFLRQLKMVRKVLALKADHVDENTVKALSESLYQEQQSIRTVSQGDGS